MARRIILVLVLCTAQWVIVWLILYWDRAILDLTLRTRSSAVADLAWVVSILGYPPCYFLPAAILFLFYKGFRPVPVYANRAMFVLLASTAPAFFTDLLKLCFGRSRPILHLEQQIYEFRWFQNAPEFASFPSEHATAAAAVAVAMSLLFPNYRLTFALFALLVAVSRVLLIVHFPSDVIAGLVVGTLFALLLRATFERYGFSLYRSDSKSPA